MSIIEKLTEGIIHRNVQKEGQALLNKWEKTGLLEGIGSDNGRGNMASLLENQAKELLREASSMQVGDVEGFAAVAFPIVRRVFGGLIANELVSVQPMSLPSGLIFFLDFTFNSTRFGNYIDKSVYGTDKVGMQITGGVSLGQTGSATGVYGGNGPASFNELGFYNLNNGYASPTGSGTVTVTAYTSGTFGSGNPDIDNICRFDPDLTSGTTDVYVGLIDLSQAAIDGGNTPIDRDNLITLTMSSSAGQTVALPQGAAGTWVVANGPGLRQARRLTQFLSKSTDTNSVLVVAVDLPGRDNSSMLANVTQPITGTTAYTWAAADNFTSANLAKGAVVGTTAWALESNADIPEIDIKVDSVSITAMTKKLKAKWTPELQQDINAYHNLDAEVELTGILSEQIALEIDQEILGDLVNGATAGTYYWSRKPGKFVNKTSGVSTNQTLYPDFTGTVSEWYETLLETVNDVSAQIHRKTLRGGANFLVCSPEVANIMEFTAGFRADTTADENKGTAGAVKVGQISKKWDIYVDPYFPRPVILVGRKGNSFLESGYVYAPYVPLQVTPTIFGPEDFVPRKGVMTRYGKKMVRPDMYGLVIVEDLLG